MLEGGEVMGLAGSEYGVILQRRRLVRMNVTGDVAAPFSYDPIAAECRVRFEDSVLQL